MKQVASGRSRWPPTLGLMAPNDDRFYSFLVVSSVGGNVFTFKAGVSGLDPEGRSPAGFPTSVGVQECQEWSDMGAKPKGKAANVCEDVASDLHQWAWALGDDQHLVNKPPGSKKIVHVKYYLKFTFRDFNPTIFQLSNQTVVISVLDPLGRNPLCLVGKLKLLLPQFYLF